MAEKAMTPDEFYKKLAKEDRRAIKDLTVKKKIDFIPTGSWVINTLIGDGTGTYKPGGLPRGHVVEVFGNESCGKTTLGISACKQAQLMGGLAVWLDFERTFHREYATTLGLDCSPSKFVFAEPDHFEHGIKLIYESLAMKPAIIVVDSVSAMIPKQFLEGTVDEMGRIGLQAQLMSISLNYLTKYLSEANTCLLFTNQLRSVIKGKYDQGPDEESSGGRAIKYYSSVRLKMRTGAVEKVELKSRITGKKEKEPVNVMVKVSVVKNKVDKPHYSGPIYVRFGSGFDNISSIIELATNTNVIKKSGAMYEFSVNGQKVFSARGKEQLRTLLEENPEMLKTLTNNITFTEDEEVKNEADVDELADTGDGDLDAMLNQASETFVKDKEKVKNVKRKN